MSRFFAKNKKTHLENDVVTDEIGLQPNLQPSKNKQMKSQGCHPAHSEESSKDSAERDGVRYGKA